MKLTQQEARDILEDILLPCATDYQIRTLLAETESALREADNTILSQGHKILEQRKGLGEYCEMVASEVRRLDEVASLKALLRDRPTINPDCPACIAIEKHLDSPPNNNIKDERPIVPESWVCSCGQKISQEVMEYRIRCQVCETVYRGEPCDGQGGDGGR